MPSVKSQHTSLCLIPKAHRLLLATLSNRDALMIVTAYTAGSLVIALVTALRNERETTLYVVYG